MAEAGTVIVQAWTIGLAAFQRTAVGRGLEWPRKLAMNQMPMQALWAETCWPQLSVVAMRKPMVRTIRQPPISVPTAIAFGTIAPARMARTIRCRAHMRIEQQRIPSYPADLRAAAKKGRMPVSGNPWSAEQQG